MFIDLKNCTVIRFGYRKAMVQDIIKDIPYEYGDETDKFRKALALALAAGAKCQFDTC